MIPCELDLTSTPFSDTTIITYDIELPPSVKRVCFNLLYDEDFTIPYITDTIPNSPSGHQLLTQNKQNVCIIDINVKEPITYQGALYELNCHKIPFEKFKFNNSLCIRKSYQRTDLEDISFRFD